MYADRYALFAKLDEFMDRMEKDTGRPQARLDFDGFVARWESLDEQNQQEWAEFFWDYDQTKKKTDREALEELKRHMHSAN